MHNLEKLYLSYFGTAANSCEPLKGDGSDRQIFRLHGPSKTCIGIYGNNDAENKAFVNFTRHFFSFNLPVPEIYITDLENQIYLEEDLGYDTLFDWMSRIRTKDGFNEKIISAYCAALERLPEFQITAGKSIDFSYCYQHDSFAKESMLWDLEYFRHRFLDNFYNKTYDHDELEKDMLNLVNHLEEEKPHYFLYRDFQSRNIMILDERPHFIDYQSGRRGALQYDVASLLYDAKANIPQDIRDNLLEHYLEKLSSFVKIDNKRFKYYFPGFVLIRIMQAFGAYGYLSTVKGKKHFLKSVPFAIRNLEIMLEKDITLNNFPTLRKIFSDLVTDKSLREF